MRNLWLYIIVCILSGLAMSTTLFADDYIDDVYYSQQVAFEEELRQASITPFYNKKSMLELRFVEDTIPVSVADTALDVVIQSDMPTQNVK